MKNFKRIASLVLALTMILCMGVTAFASSITITNPDTREYTYEAYQIFAGNYNKDETTSKETLSDIVWGSAIVSKTTDDSGTETTVYDLSATLIAALKSADSLKADIKDENGDAVLDKDDKQVNANIFATELPDDPTAENVANILIKYGSGNETAIAKAFAEVVGNVINEYNETAETDKKVIKKAETSPAASDDDDENGETNENKPVPGVTVIPDLDAGYYLVQNSTVPDAEDLNGEQEVMGAGSYTRYILQVIGDTQVAHKGEVPKVDKYASDDNGEQVNINSKSVGDTVNYKFIGTMPSNIADYDTYYYVFTDNMSKGLTLTSGSIKVYLNSETDDNEVTEYFYIDEGIYNAVNGTTITVGIDDLKELANVAGKNYVINANTTVIVVYEAVLNENAVIGTANENEVDLTFSNDPNDDGEPSTNTPDGSKPNAEYPTGKTPKSEVETYTTEIFITKVNPAGDSLTGAQFNLSGEAVTTRIIVSEAYVALAANETLEAGETGYYKLLNGEYTTDAPVVCDEEITALVAEDHLSTYGKDAYYYTLNGSDATRISYAEAAAIIDANNADEDKDNDIPVYVKASKAETKENVIIYTASTEHLYADSNVYKLTTVITEDTENKKVDITATVDKDGILKFQGLNAGTYTIKEVKAADGGYNLLKSPITVVVAFDKTNKTWSYTWSSDDEKSITVYGIVNGKETKIDNYSSDDTTSHVNHVDVINTQGAQLPSTGGIGTTIFYIAGGVLLVGAAVLLITKRRMNING